MSQTQRVIDGFKRVKYRLENHWGITVKEVPGWETRGVDVLRPRGFVRHHTASSRASGTYGALRLVTHGRSDLRNALCNWYQPRESAGRELWIVAARVAWHAGRGGWQGLRYNSSVVGLEAENDGRGEPWGPDQRYSALALDVELGREFGWSPRFGCEHKEWAPDRKIDRAGISGAQWRSEVSRALAAYTTAPTNLAPTETYMRRNDSAPANQRVLFLQARLKWWAGADIALDGLFGPATEDAVKTFQKRVGLTPDGVFTEVDAVALAFLGAQTESASTDLSGLVSVEDFANHVHPVKSSPPA